MKIILNAYELKKRLGILYSAVSHTTVLPILECFFISVLKNRVSITVTDLETYICYSMDCNSDTAFDFCIDARLFNDFIKNSLSQEVTIEVCDKKLHLSSGGFKTIVQRYNPMGYPKAPEVGFTEKVIIDSFEFKEVISVGKNFVSTDYLRPSMCNIYLEVVNGEMEVAATDAHRLYFDKIKLLNKIPESKHKGLLPLKSSVLLSRLISKKEEVMINFSGDSTEFTFGDFYLCCRSCDASTFPAYKNVIPQNDIVFYLKRKNFLAFLKLGVAFVNRCTYQLDITVNSERVSFYGKDADYDTSFEYTLPVFNPSGSFGFVFACNMNYLIEVSSLVKDEFIKINHSSLPQRGFIVNDKFLLMPMMINL